MKTIENSRQDFLMNRGNQPPPSRILDSYTQKNIETEFMGKVQTFKKGQKS